MIAVFLLQYEPQLGKLCGFGPRHSLCFYRVSNFTHQSVKLDTTLTRDKQGPKPYQPATTARRDHTFPQPYMHKHCFALYLVLYSATASTTIHPSYSRSTLCPCLFSSTTVHLKSGTRAIQLASPRPRPLSSHPSYLQSSWQSHPVPPTWLALYPALSPLHWPCRKTGALPTPSLSTGQLQRQSRTLFSRSKAKTW